MDRLGGQAGVCRDDMARGNAAERERSRQILAQGPWQIGQVLEARHLGSAEAEQQLAGPIRGLAAGLEPRGERIRGDLADRRGCPGERQLSHGVPSG
jgi:hypothetical protein